MGYEAFAGRQARIDAAWRERLAYLPPDTEEARSIRVHLAVSSAYPDSPPWRDLASAERGIWDDVAQAVVQAVAEADRATRPPAAQAPSDAVITASEHTHLWYSAGWDPQHEGLVLYCRLCGALRRGLSALIPVWNEDQDGTAEEEEEVRDGGS